jgi:hypothetical protein
MARHISAAELAPGDLMFLGTDINAPYHVGMYVGGGMTVVAPHTGAEVSYEPLADIPWDGFGRLLAGPPAEDPVASGAEAAAREYDVPPDVVSAELRLGLDTNPYRVAVTLQQAMERDHNDLMQALTDQLKGDPSQAAIVMRAAAGPALGSGFAGTIKLLPRPQAGTHSPPVSLRGGGWGWGSLVSGVSGTLGDGAGWIGDLRGGGGIRFPEHLGHGANLLLDIGAAVPNKTVSAFGQVVSAGWDVGGVIRAIGAEGAIAGGVPSGVLWAVQIGIAGYGLYRARTWRARLYNGAMLAGGILGLAGTILVVVGLGAALTAAAPFLVAAAIIITAAATMYDNWDTIKGAATRAVSWCRDTSADLVDSAASFLGF